MHEPDWTLGTWEGIRRAQQREFQALSFRDKVRALENLGEVTDFFARRAKQRAVGVKEEKRAYGES